MAGGVKFSDPIVCDRRQPSDPVPAISSSYSTAAGIPDISTTLSSSLAIFRHGLSVQERPDGRRLDSGGVL
jgi:hypothetical protein